MPSLYTSEAVDVRVYAEPERRSDRVWIGLRTSLPRDEIDKLCTVVCQCIADAPRKVLLHLEHVPNADPELVPPDLAVVLCIVGRLMEYRDVLASKLRGTCIQAQRIDEPAKLAKSLFLSVYNPSTPMDIVDSPEEARRFLDTIVQKRVKA